MKPYVGRAKTFSFSSETPKNFETMTSTMEPRAIRTLCFARPGAAEATANRARRDAHGDGQDVVGEDRPRRRRGPGIGAEVLLGNDVGTAALADRP